MLNKSNHKILLCGFLVLLFIIIEIGKFLTPQNIYSPIFIGQNFINKSEQSTLISSKKVYATTPDGYDGQFFYYIALDPINARYYIDNAAYRYQRIFYPALVRILSFNNLEVIPYLMLTVNIAAIIASVVLLGKWLQNKGISPYFSLIYGLYPGIHFSLQRDLSEPLAYFLVILGVFIYSQKKKRSFIFSSFIFSLAILTREMALIFPLTFWLWDLARLLPKKDLKILRQLIISVVTTLTPFILYKIFLSTGLNITSNYFSSYSFSPLPFGGVLTNSQDKVQEIIQIFSVVIPGVIMGGLGIYLATHNKFNQYILSLFLNFLILVVFLGPSSYVEYTASGRIATGVIVASLFCLPILYPLKKIFFLFMFVVVLWLTAWKLVHILPPLHLNLLIPLTAFICTIKMIAEIRLKKF